MAHGMALAVHIDGAGVSLATEANAGAGDCCGDLLYYYQAKDKHRERETYSAFNFQLEALEV